MKAHIVVSGEEWPLVAKNKAMVCHGADYVENPECRTRISAVLGSAKEIHDFVFEYQELFDNSYWRIVDLTVAKPKVELHRPQYEGRRKDFVDVEWEFIIGHLSHPVLQEKLRRWANDPKQRLTVSIVYDNVRKSHSAAEKLKRRLPSSVKIEVCGNNPEEDMKRKAELMQMARYLHYFYQVSYELKRVPAELPEEEVNKAWDAIEDEKLKMSNLYNVMSIPVKMEILGHARNDWDKFYALTAEEIERLTAVEHNRWCVERMIQGVRPCTDQEREEIEEDLRKRLADGEYAKANPVSLKKRYKNERNAHYDLCAFSELGVDETGLSVTRYDRDLTAAIPLIVKTYNDRPCNG